MNHQETNASWLDGRPRLRDDLVFRPQPIRGRTVLVVEDPLRSKFYRLGQREYQFIAALNGQNTIGEALALGNDRHGSLSERDAAILVSWARQNHLLDGNYDLVAPEATPVAASKARSQVWNPVFIRVPLLNPEPWIARAYPYAQWLFTPIATIVHPTERRVASNSNAIINRPQRKSCVDSP